MTDSKRLYFLPIIARALQSDDPKQAMEKAFDDIKDLGKQEEYKEGFQQFMAFIKTAVKPSEEDSKQKLKTTRNAIYHLIYDLGTDTFDGDEKQKEALIASLKNVPEWDSEYERIKKEAQTLLLPEKPLEVEILRENQIIGSYPVSSDPTYISSVTPGKYIVRFSNGRSLWEGELTREDLIWAYAYPKKDLQMAAETETFKKEPTKKISLLNGEMLIHIYPELESGEMKIELGYEMGT